MSRPCVAVPVAAILGALLASALSLIGGPIWLRVVATALGILIIWRYSGWLSRTYYRDVLVEKATERHGERRECNRRA